jgi:hypothetical protein
VSEQEIFKNKHMSVAICNGLNPEDESRIFERINRATALTAGELIDSYIYCPVAQFRNEVFGESHTINTWLSELIGPYKASSDKRKSTVANLTAYVCGAALGPEYITNSFPKLQPALETTPEDWEPHKNTCDTNLMKLINIWNIAVTEDNVVIPTAWSKSNRIWKLSFINGYILYSFWDNTASEDTVIETWREFIKKASRDAAVIDDWHKSLNCRNNNMDTRRLKRGWKQVKYYVVHNCFETLSYDADDDSDTD